MSFDMCSLLNTMDIFYIIGMPAILVMLLITEKRSRKRLEQISQEIKETNELLAKQLEIEQKQEARASS